MCARRRSGPLRSPRASGPCTPLTCTLLHGHERRVAQPQPAAGRAAAPRSASAASERDAQAPRRAQASRLASVASRRPPGHAAVACRTASPGGTACGPDRGQRGRARERLPMTIHRRSFDLRRANPYPGKAHVPERLHLGLERHAEALQHAAAALGHHREHIGGGRRAGVLDEVRVLGREARAADRQAVAAGLGQQQPGAAAPRRARSSGFLNVEPNVLIPCGWASWRRSRISASVALTVVASAPARARTRRARRSPRRPGSSGGSRSRAPPARGARPRRPSRSPPTRAPARARRRRRLRSSAPRRRRCRGCSRRTRSPTAPPAPRARRPPAAARRRRTRSRSPSCWISASLRSSFTTRPAHALVGDQQVRARPDDARPARRVAAPSRAAPAAGRPTAGAREVLGLAAGAHRRQAREREVALHDRRGRRGESLDAIALTSLAAERVDVAGAHHDAHIALAEQLAQDRLGVGEAWAASTPACPRPRPPRPRRPAGRSRPDGPRRARAPG